MQGRRRALWLQAQPVQYFEPLYRALADRQDIDVTVGFMSVRAAESGYHDRDFGERVRWDVALLDGYRWVDLSKQIGSRLSIALSLRKWHRFVGRFDIVIAQGYRHPSTLAVWCAARMRRRRWAYMSDAVDTRPSTRAVVRSAVARDLMLKLIVRASDGVITTSSRGADFHHRLAGRRCKVFLVPHVANTELFSPPTPAERLAARRALGVHPDAVVFGFVGKLVPWKRPGDLIAAIAQIPGCTALLVGSGPLRASLERQAIDQKVERRVIFAGFRNQTELRAIYAAMDAAVLPSSREAYGIVVHEAALCELPVVCTTACGAFEDLVAPVTSDLGYEAGSVEQLAAILTLLTRDERQRRTWARESRRVAVNFNSHKQASALAAAIASMADGNPAGNGRSEVADF